MPPLRCCGDCSAGIALFAAFINGALGYGFSSLTVPMALVFYTNRILNPAMVLVEVVTNFYVLFINLKGVAPVWKRVLPIVIGLLPGIGSRSLNSHFASARLDQARDLHTHSAPHPGSGSRLAETNSVNMAGRSSLWDRAGHPVFSHDHLRTAVGDPVQQPRSGQNRVSGRPRVGSRGRVERDRHRLLPAWPVYS